jgi:drug/metabolite transporter (DMT)-like permease
MGTRVPDEIVIAAGDPPAAAHPADASRWRAWLLLGAVAVVWGSHWTVAKIGLEDVPPFSYAALRVLLAGVVMGVVLGATRRLRPPARADLPIVVSYGIVGIAATIACMNLGLGSITAGRASILSYTLPLWVVPIMAVARRSRPTGPEWLGLALGMAGLVLLLAPASVDWGAPGALAGAAFLLLGAVAGAFALVHVRLHRWSGTPFEVQPWQLLVALVPLGILAIVESGSIAWGPRVVLVLLYSGPLATAFAYWASQSVTRAIGPLATGVGFLAVPVIGVTLGALVLGEPVGPAELLGLLVTGAGVAVVLLRARADPAPSRDDEPLRETSAA